MEGIFIYAEKTLHDAVRARAYKERRTISDVGREAIVQALTEPVETVAEAWYNEKTHCVIGRAGGWWVFAWAPERITRVWARDVASEVSTDNSGATWCKSEPEAKAVARAWLERIFTEGEDEGWREVAKDLGIDRKGC